ncbi:MAG TPA: DUF3570 domain-containing protein [Steroidobacteraceae bacterium]|nr:DUF3570 domain-containing protein [Steroidobacteraceae bacterium]
MRGVRRPGPAALTQAALAALLYAGAGRADVLPDDRADVLISRYSGGGQTIDGTSVLVRKKIGDHVSLAYNHLTDTVSGASIDVRTSGASPYTEVRTQDSLSADILFGNTTYSVGAAHSSESDYASSTENFGISQSMFGDLTTVNMSYRRTFNDVYKNECVLRDSQNVCEAKIHDPSFGKQDMDERSYGVGLTQVLTRNSLLGVNLEVITDQGWLSNPYRDYLYAQPGSGSGYALAPEVFPNTRTSNAVSFDYKYYLSWRAALDVQYRYFQDTWGIRSSTAQLDYTQPWRNWTFDGILRFYTQTHADFYSDLFAREDEFNFMTHSRELSAFNSYDLGITTAYQFNVPVTWIQKSTVNLRYDHFFFIYHDYRDALLIDPSAGVTAGNEPLYSVQLDVVQLFPSVWY